MAKWFYFLISLEIILEKKINMKFQKFTFFCKYLRNHQINFEFWNPSLTETLSEIFVVAVFILDRVYIFLRAHNCELLYPYFIVFLAEAPTILDNVFNTLPCLKCPTVFLTYTVVIYRFCLGFNLEDNV